MNIFRLRLVDARGASLGTPAIFEVSILIALLSAGCVSKKQADAQARAAFLAGQGQALEMFHQAQMRGPSVTVVGEVKNSFIPWTADLTLAKALVAADYHGTTEPTEILLARQGKATSYDPKKLLNGDDVPLQPNDVVQIKQ
jgi:hypothetical protein